MDTDITFLIFTYNEARRIEFVLRALTPYGRVVIMDNHSTDDTEAIARRYGAEVHQHDHPGWVEEESVARNALSKVQTRWVYWGYADEIPTRALLERFVDVVREDRYKWVNVFRKNLHYGFPKLNYFPAIGPRLFRKDHVDFGGTTIHSFGKFTGRPEEILTLPMVDELAVNHCSTYNVKKFELAHSGYSDLEARLRYDSGRRFSGGMLLVRPAYFFCRIFFLEGGWRSGWGGLIMAMQYAIFFFNVYAKLWEIQHGVTLESIEGHYDRFKEELLAETPAPSPRMPA